MKRDFSLTPTSRSGRVRRPLEVAMTPMIDVIFLLLIFFLATSSFQLVEHLLPSGISSLPNESGTGAEPPPEPTPDALEQIVVKLELVGNSTVAKINGITLQDLSQLQARLRTISSVKADVPVIIDPQPKIKAADVVRAYDFARQAGLARVYLATRE
ncbi:ExbD/TolR family protein [Aureliella helgolandensis]|uniref:Biopolymer transport protein ExbD/TolR n=1 Tax=Aureliella helgolandensis TaxID=2527968 RepID=A0A518GCK3_9BACT|nr:biopolymer transporter ExbD [Aureliella helgolandensis]QDV26331.1 Biopolymer transport protein ExbD/TolR [Aureliella helgolandensis]